MTIELFSPAFFLGVYAIICTAAVTIAIAVHLLKRWVEGDDEEQT